MKKLLMLLLIVGILIGTGCCDKDNGSTKTTVHKETYKVITSPAEDAKRVKEENEQVIEKREKEWEIAEQRANFPDKKWPDQLAKLIPPEYFVAIRLFLMSHEAEFGLFSNVRLIGTTPNTGVTAYNVSLTNGRKLQFWFRADKVYLVGEEVNGGFIAHYGR